MKRILFSFFMLFLTAPVLADPQPRMDPGAVEQKDREVDTAALDAMKVGARRLINLAERKRESREEKDILIKLVESLQKINSVEFRLAYGPGGKENAARLAEYRQSLRNTVRAIDRLTSRYPNDPFIPKAYLFRGRAYKDLGELQKSEKDYMFVANRWANEDAGSLAMLNLCDLLVEQRDYRKAIVYLKQLEARPNKPFHSMVLEHLAWAYYYENDLVSALKSNEKRITFHDRMRAYNRADQTDAESASMNAALFYAKMIEKKVAGVTVAGAMPYFKSVIRGSRFGKVLVRFAFHLRTNNLDSELEEWQRATAAEPMARNEAIEILLVTLENQVNRRRFAQVRNTMAQFPALLARGDRIDPTSKNAAKARQSLLLAAGYLQESLKEKKNTPEAPTYVEMLRGVYAQILALSDPRDKSVPKLHFNLAELNFEYKNYLAAEKHYRWIVENGKMLSKEDAALPRRAWLSAISARYELLRQKNLIPKELKARSIADGKASSSQDPQFTEWLRWLSVTENAKTAGDALDVFIFEANRALYAQNHYGEALTQLKAFVDSKPKSQYAVPSASLVLDTYIASYDWEKAYEYSKYLLDMGFAKSSDFGKRLVSVSGDTYFKMIEGMYQKKEYAQVLAKTDDFMRRYPNSPRIVDSLSIAGNSALGMGDKRRAMLYLGRAMDRAPSAEIRSTTLVTRASLAEEQYDFDTAAKTYRVYFEGAKDSMKSNERNDLRRKILYLTLLSGRPGELKSLATSKAMCSSELAAECERYEALAMLLDEGTRRNSATAKAAFSRFQETRGASAIWATIALENHRAFKIKDRLALVDAVTKSWNQSDAVIKYTLLPFVSESLPSAFELSRSEIRKTAPLTKIQKDLIDRRSAMMQSLEDVGGKVSGLPWLRIRAAVLNELATMYFEFGKDINRLPMPEGLAAADLAEYRKTIAEITAPFEKKAQDFRKSAFELATLSAIDEPNLKAVSTSAFAENPNLVKDLRKDWSAEGIRPISLGLLRRVDARGGWDGKLAKTEDPGLILKARMAQALSAHNWPQISFLLSEINTRKALPGPMISLVKAVSFAEAGAQAEAVSELQESVSSFSKEQSEPLYLALISAYYASFAKEKAKAALQAYFSGSFEQTSEPDRVMVVSAARWLGINPPSEFESYRSVAGKGGTK